MNGSRLSIAAERAAQRYLMLLGALGAVFANAVQQPHPGSAKVKHQAVDRAYSYARTYLAEESVFITQAFDQEILDARTVTLGALQCVGSPDCQVNDHIEAITTDLENALRVQPERDIASMTRGLRDVALRAALVGRARGVPQATALASLRQNNTLSPSFVYVDRAGKRWPSQKLVRTVWRQGLLLGWNETAMLTMADFGVTEAIIEHPNPSYAELGTVISLTETDTGITWDQIRDDVFHPNANAWLSPHISAF